MKKYFPIAIVFFICFNGCSVVNYNARKGTKFYDAQKYEKAAKHLEKVESAGGADAQTYYMLGTSYCYLSRFEDALPRLEKAAFADPKNPQIQFNLGNAYYNLGKPDAAAIRYRRAIELKPDYLEAIEALAMLSPDGGVGAEEACHLWKQALKLETREDWIIRANHYIEQIGCEGVK